MTTTTMETPATARQKLSTATLVCVVVGVLIQATSTLEAAGWVASAGLVLYWAIEGRATSRIGQIILVAGAALSGAAALFDPEPGKVLGPALAEASFVIGLFMALGLLREAADTSPLVQACGVRMVQQPPGRRYLALTFGSHSIAIVLNFGVMPLLGVMINKGNTLDAAGNDPELREARQRSMMMAIFRGFALMTAWSPLSIVFAIAQSILLGVPWWKLVVLQFVITMILLLFGACLDGWRRREEPLPSREAVSSTGQPLAKLGLLIAAILGVSILVTEILDVRMVIGAMLTVPLAAWFWLTVQQSERGLAAPTVAGRRLISRMTRSFPASRNEVTLIGGSMYAGIVGASMLPTEAVGQLLVATGIPPVLIAIAMAWTMMILAQCGISHIITLAFFSGAIPVLAGLGLDPIITVSGLMTAWALSICTTPVGAGVLLISRLSETPVQTIVREWNAVFVIGGAFILAIWMAVLAQIL
jgi:hypothetical protein